MYIVHRHKTDPRRFFIYEQYKDDAALEAHRAAPHFLQHAKKDLPRIADRVEGITKSQARGKRSLERCIHSSCASIRVTWAENCPRPVMITSMFTGRNAARN